MEIGYTINRCGRKRLLQFFKKVKNRWVKIGEYKTYPYDVKGYLSTLREGSSLVLLGEVCEKTSDRLGLKTSTTPK
jgi:hypothetical protein